MKAKLLGVAALALWGATSQNATAITFNPPMVGGVYVVDFGEVQAGTTALINLDFSWQREQGDTFTNAAILADAFDGTFRVRWNVLDFWRRVHIHTFVLP